MYKSRYENENNMPIHRSLACVRVGRRGGQAARPLTVLCLLVGDRCAEVGSHAVRLKQEWRYPERCVALLVWLFLCWVVRGRKTEGVVFVFYEFTSKPRGRLLRLFVAISPADRLPAAPAEAGCWEGRRCQKTPLREAGRGVLCDPSQHADERGSQPRCSKVNEGRR